MVHKYPVDVSKIQTGKY